MAQPKSLVSFSVGDWCLHEWPRPTRGHHICDALYAHLLAIAKLLGLCWRLLASLHSTPHCLGYTEPRTGTATRRQLYLPDDWVKIDGIALELQPAIF